MSSARSSYDMLYLFAERVAATMLFTHNIMIVLMKQRANKM